MLVKLTRLRFCIQFHYFKVLYFIKRNIRDSDKTPYKDAVRTVAGDGDITVDGRAMYVYSYYYKARHHVVFQHPYSSTPK